MKKFSSRKGFTLVELMIVIAIIGILAAVLYPAMTGYFERSRDTNRQGALRNISLSLGTYNTDNNKYPGDVNSKCVSDIETELKEHMKAIPVDPKKGQQVAPCTTNESYGYKWLKSGSESTAGGNAYAIAANMEVKGNATISATDYASKDSLEDMGKYVKGSNEAETSLENATRGTWFYVVAQ